jgi:hypothetical protein
MSQPGDHKSPAAPQPLPVVAGSRRASHPQPAAAV